ncbi:tape measure protein [Comamonas sp. B21-038]|uniref:tape measure protein n=1 Tax=Comamonas sp. B21-038 TaxID=2918299 RepID=UPI001EFA79C1|nr:tape measure protein [Comamonas sp. B21-038]ULR87374.1 tape measure protein [Comamonas sp. B21-038]
MEEVTAIGVKMATDDIERGIKKLDDLSKQGPKVEQSMAGISAESKKVAKSLADLGSGGGASGGLRRAGEAAKQTAEGLKQASNATREAVTDSASLARAMNGLTAAEENFLKSLRDQAAAIKLTRGDFAAYQAAQQGMSIGAQETARAIGNRIDALKAEQRELAQASREADKYAKDMLRASASSSAAEKSFRALNTAANAVSAALSIIGVGFGAREIITQIDGYTKFTAQLKLATKGASDYSAAMASVQRISTDAQQGIGELGTLYARIANGTASLNLSQQKLSDITETVALSLKVSGATASEASSAMLQLSQAFASGVLRGEEFNSVNEAAPRLMKALADGLGVPVGALRKMAEAGQLTSAVLAESLPKALGKLREEAESVQTISGAFTVLKNNIMLMVGAQATASGATKGFANGISLLANNLDVLATVGGAVALVLGARFTASIASTGVAFAASTIQAARYQLTLASMAGVSTTAATGLIAMGGAARGASAAMAFLGGPLGVILTVAGAATAAFYTFRDSSESLVKSIGGLNQPLDELKKKLDALPPEKQIVIKMAIQDEQQRSVKQAQKLTDDLIQSIAGAANIRMPADQFDLMIDALKEASKEGGNLAPVLQNAVSAGYLPQGRVQEWLNMAAALRELQSAARGAAEAQSTTVPLVSAENNVFLQRARAALDAAKSYKSQAERMREVQDAGKKLAGELKSLQNAQLGNSKEAKDLEERIKGVNEQLASMAKKGRDTSGAAAIKKEQSEYEKLISAIQLKIAENAEELQYGHKLSEAEKLRFLISEQGTKKLTDGHKSLAEARLKELEDGEKLLKQKKAQAEAEEGYRKFLDGIYKSAEAIGNLTEQQDAANASFGKSKVAIAEMAAEQAKLVLLNAKDMGPWTPEHIAALKALTDQHERYVESLRKGEYIAADRKYDDGIRAARDELQIQQYSMSLLGEQELKRNKMIAVRRSEIKLARELAEIEKTYMGRTDETSVKQRTDLERKARVQAEEELQVELGQIQNQYVNEQVQKYDQIFSQGFADMLNGNEGSWKSFTKSLTTTFKTQVADQIYQMFARPIVVQLVGSLLGMTGGAGGLLGGLLGGGSGGGGGVMGLLSNGSSAYSLYSGEGLLGQGSRYVANMFGFGGAAPWQAAGAQASGAVTMPVTGGLGGAAPGSTSFMGLNGGYAAAGVMMIPLIAAYLGGMFKEERQVGAGITGELGGDLYGYQLMRESGSLFGGPKYRYLVAEKEIEKSNAEIERLKKEIADNPNDARNGYRERQLQQQYSRLEMLSQYDGAIEASKGPIKILQDAFTAMREDTAARADSLKLDGDSIRAMKVTLGIDEIHPDTGGKGLELTGLSQEEAAAKIQAALAQANEEMARSVLGTWQEQTREVTRMVWDNVELPSDGDTQQYGMVGREVTETITEQVFVMSEYVRAGETAVQALTRLSDSLFSVNSVFDMLGLTLMDTSLAGADMASDIIDAFGGADKFSAATGNYYDKFYTDQEKVKNQTRLLNDQLKKLGIETMPASREALKEYINGIDKSTEEGQKLFASLLGLVDVFDMIYTSAENIASLKQDLNLQLLRAQGNDAEAQRLEREKQIKELEKYNDPELVRMQREVWAAEDKKKAEEEAKQALESAKSLAMNNLQAAIGREKEHWNTFAKTAQEKLTQAASYFDMFTGAAKSLRGSVEDVATYQAAAGMVYIEQALANARRGLGLGDYDQAKTAVEAASSGLVMSNYATQAELDYDKKVLAAQLEELGEFAGVAKSDAQKQIDLANDQIKRLDDTLSYWKDYGQDQIDATLSVTDAVNALFKLLDPKEQERIKKEEAAKAGLGGGSTPATTGKAGSGATLGGTVSGTAGRYVVGFTADGRAKWSDGTVEKYAAGQYQYDGHLLVGSGNLTADQWAAMQAGQSVYGSGWYFDEKQGLWMKRKSFAVGTNYVPYDMTANIHQGERIIPAADNRALMAALNTQGGGNAELITAVKKLEERLASIDHNTADVAVTNRRLDANIDQVSEGGNGLRVVNPG